MADVKTLIDNVKWWIDEVVQKQKDVKKALGTLEDREKDLEQAVKKQEEKLDQKLN